MGDVTRSANASADTGSLMRAAQISGDLYAGEDLAACAPCYIKASDGKVYQSNGTADNEAAKFDGFTARATPSGQPVTLYGAGVRMQYGSALAIGTDLFVSANAGQLADAPSTGGRTAIARVITATDIRVTASSEDATPAGQRVASGVHQQAAATDTVVTGLASVKSVVVTFRDSPTIKQLFVKATIGVTSFTAVGFSVEMLNEPAAGAPIRSEEHTSELQSLAVISYAVFCFASRR